MRAREFTLRGCERSGGAQLLVPHNRRAFVQWTTLLANNHPVPRCRAGCRHLLSSLEEVRFRSASAVQRYAANGPTGARYKIMWWMQMW